MKMNLNRVQAIVAHDKPEIMLNLSMQVARDISQTFQAFGIKSMRLATVETMGSHELRAMDVEYFEGVPEDILRWVRPAIRGIAAYLGAFGITNLSFEYSTKDLAELRRTWANTIEDTRQLAEVRLAEAEVGAYTPTEPIGIEDITPALEPVNPESNTVPGSPFGSPFVPPNADLIAPEPAEQLPDLPVEIPVEPPTAATPAVEEAPLVQQAPDKKQPVGGYLEEIIL